MADRRLPHGYRRPITGLGDARRRNAIQAAKRNAAFLHDALEQVGVGVTPHDQWDVWRWLLAFEDHTVYGALDGEWVAFTCQACCVPFDRRITIPSSENASTSSSPFSVDEGLLLAAIRHHCASARHVANIMLFSPQSFIPAPPAEMLSDLSKTHCLVYVNGIPTIVSRAYGGNRVFDAHDRVEVPPRLYGAGSYFAHPYLHIDDHAAVEFSQRGSVCTRHQLGRSATRRTPLAEESSLAWNPTRAAYTLGSNCGRNLPQDIAAHWGSVAMIDYESPAGKLWRAAPEAPRRRGDKKERRRVRYWVQSEPRRYTIRAVEQPIDGRNDLFSDSTDITAGSHYRLVRMSQSKLPMSDATTTLTEAALAALRHDASHNLVGSLVEQQTQGTSMYPSDSE